MPKIWNKYSQKRNIGASVPISTFMCLWTNYIFPRWVCLFCWRKYVNWSSEYINRSETHECGNWGWGRAIPRKGIYKRNCRCSVAWRDGTSNRVVCRTGPPGWKSIYGQYDNRPARLRRLSESIQGLLKKFTNSGSVFRKPTTYMHAYQSEA